MVIITPFFAFSVSCAIFSKFEKTARLSSVFAGFFIVQYDFNERKSINRRFRRVDSKKITESQWKI